MSPQNGGISLFKLGSVPYFKSGSVPTTKAKKNAPKIFGYIRKYPYLCSRYIIVEL